MEGGCLQDDPHSGAGGCWAQLVSLVRVHQFCKVLSWTKKVQTHQKCNSVQVAIALSNLCKGKLTSSLSRASCIAAAKLVG